jgi:DNA repair photolyase
MLRGRGAEENPRSRFVPLQFVPDDSGPSAAAVPTEFFADASRSIISYNRSPDVGFEASLNPYRGCEHGCVYCYARPTHEYFGLSAGLDFETRIFVKERAPDLLRAELGRRGWQPQPLMLSGVTDAYQPVERRLEVTRRCLQVLVEARNPVAIISKNALVLRDLDLLAQLAGHQAASVAITVTTLDEDLRGVLEPRTATAGRRLEAIARLNDAGIPAGVMVAPVIPGLTDHELPEILAEAGRAGARFAGYVVLRLPYGLGDLFDEWLQRHRPDRRQRVLHRIQHLRGGRLNDPRFGSRMEGLGVWAELIGDVFRTARQRAGIPAHGPSLSTAAFRRPGAQPALF